MPSLSLDLSLSGWHHAFGGGSAPQKIGGVAIGEAGSGIYSGFVLAGGEDFNSLDLLTASNPYGKYISSHRRRGRRAINSGANDYYWSPEHTGYKDSNRGVAIGSSVNDLLNVSNGTLKMATRLATTQEKNLAWETTATTGPKRPQSSSSLHSASYQAVKWPCVIEARMKLPTGAQLPSGGWPAFWTEDVLPTWANTGEFDFEWTDTGALYNNFITGNSINDSIASTITDTSDGQWHIFSMVVTAATIKFYKDGTLLATATKRPDGYVTGPMFWWFRIGVDLTPGIYGMTYNAADWTGITATMEIDYVRLWTLPNATNLGYKGTIAIINSAVGDNFTKTLPSKNELWGTSAVTEYLIMQPIETAEPGLTQTPLTGAPNTWYNQTSAVNNGWLPTFLAWNPTTRVFSGGNYDQAGRIIGHIVAWDDTNGGLAGFARIILNIAPIINISALNIVAGSSVNYDLYAACDCGQLVSNSNGQRAKIITIDGLTGSGLSYNDTTGLITGTAVAGTYNLTITCTNSIGQTTTKNVTMTIGAVTAFVSDLFNGTVNTSLLSHTADTGGSWVGHSGLPNSTSNPVKLDGVGGLMNPNEAIASTLLYYNTATPPTPDYSVKGKINIKTVVANEQIGVCGRISTSTLGYYVARFNWNINAVMLDKSLGGTITSLGSYPVTWAAGETHDIELKMLGSTISVLVDGVERISVTDTSITLAGKAGIRMYNTTAATPTTSLHLDEFSAI